MTALLSAVTGPLFKWLAIIAAVLALSLGIFEAGVTSGKNARLALDNKNTTKAEVVVVDKNVAIQGIADTNAKAIIVYKDRVETKYKTITNNIITYEKDPASRTILDPAFVRLHDAAASTVSDQDSSTGPSSGTASDSTGTGTVRTDPAVTTGQAIGTITDNYKEYQLCRDKIIKWNNFYSKTQAEVNK
jgi:hypothetical protein